MVIQCIPCWWWWFSCKAVSNSCDPMDCSPRGSSVHGISHARILEWAAISFSRGFSQPRDRTWSPALQEDSLACELPGKPPYNPSCLVMTIFHISGHDLATKPPPSYFIMKVKVLAAQLCLTLCDLMDCSLPGSSVHGILQARILEWVAIFFSRGSSWPRDRTWVSWIAGRSFTMWATREAPK